MQLSGNTVYISSPRELLPRKNLQVIQPPVTLGDTIDPSAVAAAIRNHFRDFDIVEGDSEVALAFRWRGAPAYARLAGFARGILDALPRTLAAGKPLFVVLDGDVAQTLGALLKDELGVASEVLVIDGISLWDFDYIDLGRVRMPSFTVPVTIKSLVFSEDPRVPHAHHHQHHHHHHAHGAPSPPRDGTITRHDDHGRATEAMFSKRRRANDFGVLRMCPRWLRDVRRVVKGAAAFDWKWIVIGACVAFTVYIAVIPLGFLLWQSFRTPQTAATDAVFTLGNYTAAYGSSDTWRLFWTSIQFAFGASLFAFLLGTTLAWMNERTNTPFKSIFFALSIIPLVIPAILFTVAWILLASPKIGIVNLVMQGWFGFESRPSTSTRWAG